MRSPESIWAIVSNVVPFDLKVFIFDGTGQAICDVVFVINVSSFRAQAGTKLLVMTVERRAETVVMAQGFSVCVFEAEIGGQNFTADVAADINYAETYGASERAFPDISHGIRLGFPAAFFQH